MVVFFVVDFSQMLKLTGEKQKNKSSEVQTVQVRKHEKPPGASENISAQTRRQTDANHKETEKNNDDAEITSRRSETHKIHEAITGNKDGRHYGSSHPDRPLVSGLI